jgi:glycine dehydrogenase subunit 1
MRYLPLTENERTQMLSTIGAASVDELYNDIPADIIKKSVFNLPKHKSEIEVEGILKKYANQNISASSQAFFLGAGCYYHHIPASVDYIIQRSEFLTSYTPYQPEIAQGNLVVLFEFQTIIARLTGQDIANASMYDGATATAEAALMAMRIKKDRKKVVVYGNLHPHYFETTETYLSNHPEIESFKGEPDNQTACLIVQSPDFSGEIQNISELRKKCDDAGCLLVVVINEIVSLGLLNPPSEADIVCGDAQSIGVSMSFGGPHLGFFASKKEFVRQMPGRLCGETMDADGKRGFVLTLNTREQHIRREKATSNICTNQGLMALAFTVHAELLGENGFKKLAKLNHIKAVKLADEISKIKGFKVLNKNFFNEFTIETPKPAQEIFDKLLEKNITAGFVADANKLILAVTELTQEADIQKFIESLRQL